MEPLMDYSNSHVITLDQYLGILHKKNYAKKSSRQRKGNQKVGEGSQDHTMNIYSIKCKYHEDPKAS